MLGMDYDLGKIISAFITIVILGVAIRIYLKWNASRRIDIQEPDWLKKKRRH